MSASSAVKFSGPHETNIVRVEVKKLSSQYVLNITLEFIFSSVDSLRTNGSATVFFVASTDKSLNTRIMNSYHTLSKYLLPCPGPGNSVADPRVYTMVSPFNSLFADPTSNNVQKDNLVYRRSYEMKMNIKTDTQEISNLLLSAGTYISRSMVGPPVPIIDSLDKAMVLENGAPPSNNVVLYEDKQHGSVWVGGACQDRVGNWYKGNSPYQISRTPTGGLTKLYSRLVPNTKIVSRGLGSTALQCQQPLVNLAPSSTIVNKINNLKKRIPLLAASSGRKTNYFTPLYGTKNNTNIFSCIFGFNKTNFYRENGLFAGLIKNDKALSNCFRILSIKFLRKRVTTDSPDNRLTNTFISNDVGGQYREKVITKAPKLLDIAGASEDILMITAADGGIRRNTYGIYSYGVEFEFLDNTQTMLENIVISLRTRSGQLAKIRAEASCPPNYDASSQSITDRYARKLSSRPLARRSEYRAIITYLSALNFFYGNIAKDLGASLDTLAMNLYSETNIFTNGPAGLGVLLKLIRNLISEIERFLNINNSHKSYVGDSIKINNSKYGNKRRRLTVKHYFDNFVNAEDFRDDGYDYLSKEIVDLQTSKYSPLKVVDYRLMNRILANEDIKTSVTRVTSPRDQVLTQADPFIFKASPTDPVFLTPNLINIGGVYNKINTQEPNQKEVSAYVGSSLIAANKLRGGSGRNFSNQKTTNNTTNLTNKSLGTIKNNLRVMESEGCTVEVEYDDAVVAGMSIFSYIGGGLQGKNTVSLLDAAEKLSEASDFVVTKGEDPCAEDEKKAAPKPDISTTKRDRDRKYYDDIKNVGDKILTYLVQTDYFSPKSTKGSPAPVIKIKNITDKRVFKSKDTTIQKVKQDTLDKIKFNTKATTGVMTDVLVQASGKPDSGRSKIFDAVSVQEKRYTSDLEGDVFAEDIITFSLKYGNIKKVQCLAGMNIKRNKSIKSGHILPMKWNPIWVDLTRQMVDNFSISKRPVLCRIMDDPSFASVYSAYRGVESNVYNDYFILGSPSTRSLNKEGVITLVDLHGGNFPAMNKAAGAPPDTGKYGRGVMTGVIQNVIPIKPRSQPPTTAQKGNLMATRGRVYYTNGNDFLLPDGDRYMGSYHIYTRKDGTSVAMQGPTHTGKPHVKLTPVSNKASRALGTAQRPLVMDTDIIDTDIMDTDIMDTGIISTGTGTTGGGAGAVIDTGIITTGGGGTGRGGTGGY